MKISSDIMVAEIEENGAYVKSVQYNGIDIIKRSNDGHKTHGGIAPLFPYANRIENGSYTFMGRQYQFARTKEGNSIHGYAKDIKWDVEEQEEDSVTLKTDLFRENEYPFHVICTLHICISGSRFCENANFYLREGKAPIAPGFHPYYMVDENWEINLERRALKAMKKDEYFPSGDYVEFYKNIRSKRSGYFDDLFKYEGQIVLNTSQMRYTVERINSKYFMLYNGQFAENRSVAIEPMSSPVNSFRTGDDIKVLNSGEILPFGFSFSVDEIESS